MFFAGEKHIPGAHRDAATRRTRSAPSRSITPWIESGGMPKIIDISGRDYGSMPDCHGINQTIPKRLRLAFDFRTMPQIGPNQGGIRIPIQDKRRKLI